MILIEEETKSTKLGKICEIPSKILINKENVYKIIFIWLAIIILVIVCVATTLCFYKLEFKFVQKKYQSITIKKLVNQRESPTIRQTLNGPVEGIEQTTALGQKFYSFRGIPFAEPPITGIDPYTSEQVDRRFKPPVPFKRNWTEILKAHDFKKFCQPSEIDLPPDIQNYETSEDCLFMNVFVPGKMTTFFYRPINHFMILIKYNRIQSLFLNYYQREVQKGSQHSCIFTEVDLVAV